MTQLKASLQNELFKLRKRQKYLVLLIIGVALSIAGALRLLVSNYITGGGLSRSVVMGSLVSDNLLFFLMIFLPLMAAMACCDLYVGESADHTIRFSLMRPVAKGKLFFSKALAVFCLCLFDLVVLLAATAVTQLVLGGTGKGILTSIAACLLDLIPLAVLILFFALLNQAVRSQSLSLFLCLVLYVGLWALGTYLPSAGGLLFTGYLRWHNLWLGITLPFLSLLPRIGLLVGYGLVFGCGGYLLFERKEA
jgi:ABC-2 type transport system permease protein